MYDNVLHYNLYHAKLRISVIYCFSPSQMLTVYVPTDPQHPSRLQETGTYVLYSSLLYDKLHGHAHT